MDLNGHIRWLFFDFAGTLAFNDPPRAWHYLRACARRGVFLERRAVWDAINAAWAPFDSTDGLAHVAASVGAEAYDGFRAAIEQDVLERLGITEDRDGIIKEILAAQDQTEAYSLYPEVAGALQDLRDRDYGLCVVSNFTWGLPGLVQALGIGEYFSAVVTSAQVGYRKPHPKIFEAALSATDARPQETLFVGDSFEADARGAAAFGFQSVLVDRRASGRHEWPAIALLSDLTVILRGWAAGVRADPRTSAAIELANPIVE